MKNAVDNAFLNVASNAVVLVATSAVSLWMTPYLIRHLGIKVYGLVPLFLSFMTYMGLITTLLTSAVGRFVSISYYKGDMKQAMVYMATSFWGLLTISAATFLLSAAFSPFLDKVFNVPAGFESQARWLFLMVVVSSMLAAINSTFGVPFFIQHRFFIMDSFSVVSRIVQVAVVVLGFTYVSASLAVVGWGLAAASLCTLLLTIVAAYVLMPEIEISPRKFEFKAFREMTAMGTGVLINQFGAMLYLNSDLIVINIMMGSTATGRYGPIVQWAIMIRMIAGLVTRSFDPMVMELLAKEDHEGLKSSLFRLTKMLGLILGLPICLISGFSKPLLTLWLGPDFVDLYKLMILLTLGQIVPYSLGTIFGVFRGLNTLKTPGKVTLLAGVLNIVLVVVLIKYTPLGIYGAGIATIIAVFGKSVIFNVLYLARLLKFNSWKIWDSLISGCMPAVVFTVGVFVMSEYATIDHIWKLCAYGAAAGAVYCLAAFRLFMNEADRRFTMRVMKAEKFLSPRLIDIMSR